MFEWNIREVKIGLVKRKCKLAVFFVLSVIAVNFVAIYFGFQRFHYEEIRPTPQIKGSSFQPPRSIHGRFRKGHLHKELSPYAKQRLIENSFVQQATEPSPAVIVLTYMRSGSSMTGDILQRHKDTFYVFEPLWGIMKAEENSKNITFLNGTIRQPGTYNKRDIYVNDLKGWLTCDLRLITLNSMFAFFMSFGEKTRRTWECLQDDSRPKLVCISNLQRACEMSKTKIVKTLRISMTTAHEILKDIPGSKVIHLVRDPRATLQSKKLLLPECRQSFAGNPGCVKNHCDSVWSNTRNLNKFEPDLRSRVLTVRYEDIVTEPLKNSQLLYRFIGLDYTKDVRQFAYNITLGGNIKDCKICNLNWQAGRNPDSNSSAHIAAWKNSLTMREVSEIQRRCKETLRYYGYKSYGVDD